MILRWPGSKWKCADYILSHCGWFDEYREAMLGSGAVFWQLPKWEFKRIWLNDLNPDLMRLFRAVKGEEDADFVARAMHYASTYRTGRQILDIWPVMIERFVAFHDAAAYWFINRYAVAAIVSRTRKTVASLPSPEKMDGHVERYSLRRFSAEYWADRRRQLANVELTTLDYRELLAQPSSNRCTCFVDVPYRMAKQGKLYERDLSSSTDYANMREAILASPVKVVLTTGPDVVADMVFRREPLQVVEHYYTRSTRPNSSFKNGARGMQYLITRKEFAEAAH